MALGTPPTSFRLCGGCLGQRTFLYEDKRASILGGHCANGLNMKVAFGPFEGDKMSYSVTIRSPLVNQARMKLGYKIQ